MNSYCIFQHLAELTEHRCRCLSASQQYNTQTAENIYFTKDAADFLLDTTQTLSGWKASKTMCNVWRVFTS